MLTTNNEQSRATLIQLLNARLADTIDLLFQAKQAHWSVNGPNFFALHELFDQVAHELQDPVDDIAERVAQLDGDVEGTIRMASERSSLPEYPRQLPAGGAAHVDALSEALATAATSMREAIDQSSSLGDQVTADIFTEVTRAIDKQLWMVRAHGKVQPASARPEHAPRERKSEAETRPRH